MMIFGLLLLSALAFATEEEDNIMPMVHSPTGIYHGSLLHSISGHRIYAFRGIRYAEPPIGRKRFKQTTIVRPHNGIYDATMDGAMCPQPPLGSRLIAEDCLNLNVYSTALPLNSTGNTPSNESSKPVFVFLHSGKFASHSGSSYDLNPRNMLVRDIILVTINYRLGALGFLSTGDAHAPGNAGLKDQVLALQWIQGNIQSFGGNPNSVTLAGHGAGAWSVSLHMVSPISKGLFHRAIIMSGAAPLHIPLPTNQLDVAEKLAQILRCPIDSFYNMFNCLYTRSPLLFGESMSNLTDMSIYSLPVYTPVVEQSRRINNGQLPFLSEQPADIIRQGRANFVPLLIGFDKVEFSNVLINPHNPGVNGISGTVDEFNAKWNELAPKLFGYDDNPQSSMITRGLTSFYLENKPITEGNIKGLGELYDDALTIFPMHRFERLMASHSPEPIYNYHNIYRGCGGFSKWSNGTHFSTPHYDEMLLLFGIASHPGLCQKDAQTSKHIMGMINNFMETGHPIPEESEHEYLIEWKHSTAEYPRYMEYGSEMRLVHGFTYQDRMKVWDESFPM